MLIVLKAFKAHPKHFFNLFTISQIQKHGYNVNSLPVYKIRHGERNESIEKKNKARISKRYKA